jgi:hypothetical protein
MVRPGRARQYADTYFEFLLLIASNLPVLEIKVMAAIDDASTDAVMAEDITV